MKKGLCLLLSLGMMLLLLCACGSHSSASPAKGTEAVAAAKNAETTVPITEVPGPEPTQPESPTLKDGTYTVDFNTDSSMFRANEAYDGKGTLTVKNGVMTLHVSLASKKIVNLFPGKASEAQAEGAVLLQPTEDTVTYSDGFSEVVYGFDIPVPALDRDFDLALIGTKGTWYDHVVSVSNPEPVQ